MDCFVTKISKTQALLATLGAAGAMALATTASADTRVTVQSGDTVAKLADQYHSSVEAIKEKNQLANPNVILVGQQLDIPNDDQNGNDGDNKTGDSNSQVKTVDSNVQVATNSTNEATGQSMYQDHNGIDYSSMRNAVNYGSGSQGAQGNVANTAVSGQASTQVGHGATYSPAQAVARAQSQVGTPYVWGGNQPGGFDCSGLVQWSYGLSGNNRTTYTQQAMGAHHYDVQNAQPGDLYFWGSDAAPYHTAIATGNGGYIQAPQPGQNVQNGNINWYHPNYYVSMQ